PVRAMPRCTSSPNDSSFSATKAEVHSSSKAVSGWRCISCRHAVRSAWKSAIRLMMGMDLRSLRSAGCLDEFEDDSPGLGGADPEAVGAHAAMRGKAGGLDQVEAARHVFNAQLDGGDAVARSRRFVLIKRREGDRIRDGDSTAARRIEVTDAGLPPRWAGTAEDAAHPVRKRRRRPDAEHRRVKR